MVNARHELQLGGVETPFVFSMSFDGAQPNQVLGAGFPGPPDHIGGCVLTDDGAIHCVGTGAWADMPFEGERWRMLDGGYFTACAVRADDDLIVCNDGTELDWGPIVDFAAYPYGYRTEEFAVGPDIAEASVCAITIHNEVKCAGPRYPPDIQEQLDALNQENRITYAFDYLGFE